MKFETIIFDLDGTIADTLPLCIAAFKKSIEPLIATELSEAEIIATFGPSEEGTIRKLVPDQEAAGVKAYLQHYEDLHFTCPSLFPGIREVLDLLKDSGKHLALVTGKGVHSTRISLKQFELESYFEAIETGSPNGPNKVNGIRAVLTQFNSIVDDSLYVGDAPSDIRYCKEIGIPIAAAAWAGTANPAELESLNPDWLFYSVEEFTAWISEVI